MSTTKKFKTMQTYIISLICLDIMVCGSLVYQNTSISSTPHYRFNTDQATLLACCSDTAPKPGEQRRDTTDS